LFVTTVRRLTMIIGLIIAVTMLGVNAGPLLAMIGAAGLVVGLALQGTLSNFASGILILLNRPFDVGDVINAGGVLGKVESMNLVSTSILTFDNQVMLVPNNQIWNGVITNITGRDTRRVDLVFGIGYGDDIAKAIQIIEETLTGHEKVLPHPEPVVRVNELGDNSVNLIARPWTRTSDYWDVYWDLMRDVKLRFDEAGINIPFPQRDLHVPGPIEVRFADGGAPSMPSPAGTSSASMNPTKPTHEPGPAESADDSANGD
jgi:small conductance mechanosensitive channel